VLTTLPETYGNPSLNQLQFNQYGDDCFLSGASIRGFNAGFRMVQPEEQIKNRYAKGKSLTVMAQK
jgi:hypothetical protein